MTSLERPKPLHHVALGTREVEETASFYQRIFGLAERARHHYDDGRLRSVWLDMGGSLLMVEHTEAPARRVDGVGSGPFLLAFAVDDVDARRQIEQQLADGGVEIESRTDYTSYFRDPDGNRVALSCYPLPAD